MPSGPGKLEYFNDRMAFLMYSIVNTTIVREISKVVGGGGIWCGVHLSCERFGKASIQHICSLLISFNGGSVGKK